MQCAVRLIQHGTGVGFHGVVVFDGGAVMQVQAHGGSGPFSRKVAARLGRRLRRGVGLILPGEEVRLKVFAGVLDLNQEPACRASSRLSAITSASGGRCRARDR